MQTLETLRFLSRYQQLPAKLYRDVSISPLERPFLVHANPRVAALLDLDPSELKRADFAEFFGGHKILPGSHSIAQAYTGHQFGHYNPQLGDGRGLLLGEIEGKDNSVWDLHLKGAGPTPFSRQGDGRAVLRSSIREYLAGQAMYGLGIPSTDALCIVSSYSPVYREQVERGTTLLRVSESHIRFGHFEKQCHEGNIDELKALADFVINNHGQTLGLEQYQSDNVYANLFDAVVVNTAKLIAKWQAYGFAHGVMNTDNMSILGLTLDYGPYGFLDDYEPGFICNHSDHQGRYAFNQQPGIGLWNLNALAQAFSPLVNTEALRESLQRYQPILSEHYTQLMAARLGFENPVKDDFALITEFLSLLEVHSSDYQYTLRLLAEGHPISDLFVRDNNTLAFEQKYLARKQLNQTSAQQQTQDQLSKNPKYILRNYLAQNAIAAAETGNITPLNELMQVLATPFAEHNNLSHYSKPPADNDKHLTISCSS